MMGKYSNVMTLSILLGAALLDCFQCQVTDSTAATDTLRETTVAGDASGVGVTQESSTFKPVTDSAAATDGLSETPVSGDASGVTVTQEFSTLKPVTDSAAATDGLSETTVSADGAEPWRYEQERAERDLYKFLTTYRSYERVRPVEWVPDGAGDYMANATAPLTVHVGFRLDQIKSLDATTGVLLTVGRVILLWYEGILAWDPAEFYGIRQTELSTSFVWTPYVQPINSIVYGDELGGQTPVVVFDDGTVTWTILSEFHTACEVDLRNFPKDKTDCNIDFASMVRNDDRIKLQPLVEDVLLDDYQTSNEFKLVDAKTSTHTFQSKQWNNIMDVTILENLEVTAMRVTLTIERRPLYYILNVHVPTAVLSLMVLLIFILPVQSQEKIRLGVVVILSFTVYVLIASEIIPQTSHNVPYLYYYLMALMIFVAITLIFTSCVINLEYKRPGVPLADWKQSLIFGCLAPLTCYSYDRQYFRKKYDDSSPVILRNMTTSESVDGEFINIRGQDDSPAMRILLGEISKITRKIEERDEEELISMSRLEAARILDRFFLVVLTIIFIGLIVYLAFCTEI